ncbi:MAG: S41 family peptidase [Fluviicola sp.]|jgi:hypothetical protein
MQLHKKILFLGFLFIVFSASAKSTKKELYNQKKDFAAFKSGLLNLEAKIDRGVSKDSLLNYLNYTESIFSSKELNPLEEFKYYSKCLTHLNSGHTQIQPSQKLIRWLIYKNAWLPIDFVVVNKRLYANGYSKDYLTENNIPKESQIPAGAQILEIDNQSFDKWMDKIRFYLSSDDNDQAFRYYLVSQLFDFYRILASEELKEEIPIQYAYKKDTVVVLVKTGFPPLENVQKRLTKAQTKMSLSVKTFGRFKLSTDRAYFHFPTFMGYFGPRYSMYLEQQFKKIKKKNIQTVVIDLRGNTGGNVQYELASYFVPNNQLLGSYWTEKMLKKSERKHIKKLSNEYRSYKRLMLSQRLMRLTKNTDYKTKYASIKDTSLIFKGQVFVLTDEATFSAASILASQLKHYCNAKIIGSRAGGTFYTNNAGTVPYKLPKSNFVIFFNPNHFGTMIENETVNPDLKAVDLEIIPEYNPRESIYRKNWEYLVEEALKYFP